MGKFNQRSKWRETERQRQNQEEDRERHRKCVCVYRETFKEGTEEIEHEKEVRKFSVI